MAKSLKILVSPWLMFSPAIVKLGKLHSITPMDDQSGNPDDYDLILSEKAWRMCDDLIDAKLLSVAISAARQNKYRKL